MPTWSNVRLAGKCDCSTILMISSFSDAGYGPHRRAHIPGRPLRFVDLTGMLPSNRGSVLTPAHSPIERFSVDEVVKNGNFGGMKRAKAQGSFLAP